METVWIRIEMDIPRAERKYGTSDWNGEEYPRSGTYVYEGEIDWNDENREISGNKTWRGIS